MKFAKNDQQVIEAVRAWARNQFAVSIELRNGSIFIKTLEWGIEVLAQDGWAYIHGFDSLETKSTNIENVEDLDKALDALRS